MPADELTRIDAPIEMGVVLPLLPDGQQYVSGPKRVDPGVFAEWQSRANAFFRWTDGRREGYRHDFDLRVTKNEVDCIAIGLGVLRALRAEVVDERVDSLSTEVLSPTETADVEAAIRPLRVALDDGSLGLEGDDLAELTSDLQTLEIQTRSPRPKREVVRAALRSVQRFVESPVVASVIGGAVVLGIQTLAHVL